MTQNIIHGSNIQSPLKEAVNPSVHLRKNGYNFLNKHVHYIKVYIFLKGSVQGIRILLLFYSFL